MIWAKLKVNFNHCIFIYIYIVTYLKYWFSKKKNEQKLEDLDGLQEIKKNGAIIIFLYFFCNCHDKYDSHLKYVAVKPSFCIENYA